MGYPTTLLIYCRLFGCRGPHIILDSGHTRPVKRWSDLRSRVDSTDHPLVTRRETRSCVQESTLGPVWEWRGPGPMYGVLFSMLLLGETTGAKESLKKPKTLFLNFTKDTLPVYQIIIKDREFSSPLDDRGNPGMAVSTSRVEPRPLSVGLIRGTPCPHLARHPRETQDR